MSDVVIEKVSEAFLKIFCARNIGYAIKDHYKFFAEGYRFHPLYKNPKKRVWDGKVSLLNLKNRLFPAGLLNDLTDFLDNQGYTYEYNFTVDKLKAYHISDEFLLKFYKEIFKDSSYYPRDYQHEGIKALLYNKKGVIEFSTASGKSLVIYCLIRYLLGIKRKIVLIVPNIMLVEQMRSDFKDYGWTTCDDFLTIMYMGHVPDPAKPILVSTYQSMIKQDDSFIMRYNGVIIDEAHQAPAHSIQTILSKLVWADYRMGMTGTLPDHTNPEKVGRMYEIFGYLGPLVARKPAIELINEGYLSKIKIAGILIKYPEYLCIRNRYRPYDEEVLTITENVQRNKIFGYVLNRIPENENTIILCYLLKHLDLIYNYCQEQFGRKFKIRKISGAVDADERIQIKQEAEDESGVVIVATYGTMSVGVNIKRIHNIVLGSSYKSKERVLQTIGRGLRVHESKDWLTVFDIVDDLRWKKRTGNIGLNHVWQHFEERLKHYNMQGFEITNHIINLEDL
jgi:superfamily II DNA or RNA helicase